MRCFIVLLVMFMATNCYAGSMFSWGNQKNKEKEGSLFNSDTTRQYQSDYEQKEQTRREENRQDIENQRERTRWNDYLLSK